MRRSTLYAVLCTLFLLAFTVNIASAQGNVTFRVNMKMEVYKGHINFNEDKVYLAGDYNGWAATDSQCSYTGGANYTYEFTVHNVTSTINYKFTNKVGATVSWENDPNRVYTPTGSDDIVTVWWNNDSTSTSLAATNVTLQCNMGLQVFKGLFNPAVDSVFIAGDFQGWQQHNTPMNKVNDTIWEYTLNNLDSLIQFKFLKNGNWGTSEGNQNRVYAPIGVNETKRYWYNNDSAYIAVHKVAVKFSVNMGRAQYAQIFRPDLGDIVRLAGDFTTPTWGGTDDTLFLDHDSVYSRTDSILSGTVLHYKFLKTARGGSEWEDGSDRAYTIPVDAGTDLVLPTEWFNHDSVYVQGVTGNILWNVDMSAFQAIGVFERVVRNDSMRVRGGHNGWSDGDPSLSYMDRTPGTEHYELVTPYLGTVGQTYLYKYFMAWDTNGVDTRWPAYNTDKDGHQYEHPMDYGDGNRQINLGTGGELAAPNFYFDGVHPAGVIAAGDTVTLTFQVDMRPAIAEADPFVYGSDTVFVASEDRIWWSLAGHTDFHIQLTDPDGDSVYTGSMDVAGPNHYAVSYFAQYKHAGGGIQGEGAGLGAYRGHRTRYIRPPFGFSVSNHHYYYTFPIDTWQKSAPMPIETASYNMVYGTPGIATANASNVSATSATLNGYAYKQTPPPLGTDSTNGNVYFEWGTTNAYGNTTTPTALATGNFSASISGLVAGTTYHFRAVVQLTSPGVGKYVGLDQTFFVANNYWNLVAVPYFPGNADQALTANLLPTTTANVFKYTPGVGYTAAGSLKPGVGYWAKFNGAQTICMTGGPVNTVKIAVEAGWNLIGGIAGDAPTSSVSATAGVNPQSYFLYNNGYQQTSDLYAGQGFWVKTQGAGFLTLTVPGGGYAPKSNPNSELSKLSKLIITDAAGHVQTLYVGRNFANVAVYEMPPMPPTGTFDARFASNRMVESVAPGKTSVFGLNITDAAYPVTISWDLKSQELSGAINVGSKANVMGKATGSVKVTGPTDVTVTLSGNGNLPTEFALHQNYPNPFNPSTKINYELPVDAHVTLGVYNVLGQQVLKLADEVQTAGYKTVEFNAANLPSGVYFYRLEAGSFTKIMKMMLLK